MSYPMIKVEHLSKQYKIGVDRTYKTLRDSITSIFKYSLPLFGAIKPASKNIFIHDLN